MAGESKGNGAKTALWTSVAALLSAVATLVATKAAASAPPPAARPAQSQAQVQVSHEPQVTAPMVVPVEWLNRVEGKLDTYLTRIEQVERDVLKLKVEADTRESMRRRGRE